MLPESEVEWQAWLRGQYAARVTDLATVRDTANENHTHADKDIIMTATEQSTSILSQASRPSTSSTRQGKLTGLVSTKPALTTTAGKRDDRPASSSAHRAHSKRLAADEKVSPTKSYSSGLPPPSSDFAPPTLDGTPSEHEHNVQVLNERGHTQMQQSKATSDPSSPVAADTSTHSRSRPAAGDTDSTSISNASKTA
ncbi:hypothetical protein OIV83_004556 [Microbotryomycetes sp. JL201]|nr:hypothetical protein OIV83_004556 [Microbotryomycetes sp. JL201]